MKRDGKKMLDFFQVFAYNPISTIKTPTPSTMTSLTLYYDVTTRSTMTSLTPLL